MALSGISDSLTAALISGTFAVLAAWLTWRIRKADQRVDVAAMGLEAQLIGWNNYATSLRARIVDLEDDLEKYSIRFNELQLKLSAAENRAVTLERQLIVSTQEAEHLKSLVKQAGIDITNMGIGLQQTPKPEGKV